MEEDFDRQWLALAMGPNIPQLARLFAHTNSTCIHDISGSFFFRMTNYFKRKNSVLVMHTSVNGYRIVHNLSLGTRIGNGNVPAQYLVQPA